MGTETKLNCYTESTSTGGVIPKLVKGSAGVTISLQQQQQESKHFYYYYSNGKSAIKNSSDSNGQNSLKSAKCTTTTNTVETTTVPFVPISIAEDNVVDGAKEILKVIRPLWDINQVIFKKFTDGTTNKLVGCFYNETNSTTITTGNPSSNNLTNGNCSNGKAANEASRTAAASNGLSQLSIHDDTNDSGNISDSTEDNGTDEIDDAKTTSTESTNNVVLVRVYGNKTDLLIDRKAETQNIILLHSYGMAPSLFATFKNGLAYDYVPGVTLNAELIFRPEVWALVAHRMAEMHRRVVRPVSAADQHQKQPIPMLWNKINSFFDLVPEKFTDPDKHKRFEHTFLPISRMRDEFAELYKQLIALNSPVVFAHNDLLLGNVVYTESLKAVNFIDYEYADYNFQAFDIGNHFAEFAGVDKVDYTRYPTKEYQLQWLRVYLEAFLQSNHITELEVERLYVQVNQFALASHFFWIIWSLIQAEHSSIDFDYVEYAFTRYNEYLAKKEQFLALQIPRS